MFNVPMSDTLHSNDLNNKGTKNTTGKRNDHQTKTGMSW